MAGLVAAGRKLCPMKPIDTLQISAPAETSLIDSHVHLDSREYLEDWRALLDRAAACGVRSSVVPATDLASSRRILEMAADPRVAPAVGIHPHQAASFTVEGLAELKEMTSRAVAIGETGLEMFYDFCPLDTQLVNLRAHLELASSVNLPLILHCREAEEQLYQELYPGLRGVVHCFTGPWKWAERFLELGFYLGVTGMVTYPKAETVHEVARRCPLDRLLVETDGPYLAPIPYRGRRNEPGTIPAIAAKVAELRGMDPAELARATTANTERLFLRA